MAYDPIAESFSRFFATMPDASSSPDAGSIDDPWQNVTPTIQRNRLTGEKRPKPIAGALPGLGGGREPAGDSGYLATLKAAAELVPATIKENVAQLAELPGKGARALLQPLVDAAKYASPVGLPMPGTPLEAQADVMAEKVHPASPLWGGKNLPGLGADVAESVHRDYEAARAKMEDVGSTIPTPLAVAAFQNANIAAGLLDPLVAGGEALKGVRAASGAIPAAEAAATATEPFAGGTFVDYLSHVGEEDFAGLSRGAQGKLRQGYLDALDELRRQAPTTPPGLSPTAQRLADRGLLPNGRRIADLPTAGEDVVGPLTAPAPPPAPRAAPTDLTLPAAPMAAGAPDEAGYLRLGSGKTDAEIAQAQSEKALHDAGYQIRADFLGPKQLAEYKAAVGHRDLIEAIPDKAIREDMRALLQGTPHPGVEGDTAEAVAARIEASPYAREAQDAVDAWRRRSAELEVSINAKRAQLGMEPLTSVDGYVHQTYEQAEKAAPSRAFEAPRFPQSLATPLTKEKTYLTAYDAAKAGQAPVLDFADLVLGTERAYAHTNALYDLVSQVKDLPALADGMPPVVLASKAPTISYRAHPWMPAVTTYREAPASSLLREAAKDNPLSTVFGGSGEKLFIHPALDDQIVPLFARDNPNGFDKALSFMKSSYFLGSLFHQVALGESARQVMGLRGLGEWAMRGAGIPGLAQSLEGLARNQLGREAIEEAVRAGVVVEPPALDTMQDTFHAVLGRAMAKGELPNASLSGKAIGRAAAALDYVSMAQQRALWTDLHAPLKVTAYQRLLDRTLRFRDGENLALGLGGLFSSRAKLAEMTGDQVRRAVALHVNDTFGGQNWKLLESDILANPKVLRAMRRTFLSPDWNVSAIRAGSSFMSSDPVRRAMGVNYWVGAAGLWGMYNLVSKATSGHWLWDRGAEHLFDLPTGMTETRYKKEVPVYLNIMKHTREPVELLFGRASEDAVPKNAAVALPGLFEKKMPLLAHAFDVAMGVPRHAIDFAGRKSLPLLQGVAAVTPAGHTLSGWPSAYEKQREDATSLYNHGKVTWPTNTDYDLSLLKQGIQATGEPFGVSRLFPAGGEPLSKAFEKHPLETVGKGLIPYPLTYGKASETRGSVSAKPKFNPDDVDFSQFF